MTTYLHIGMQKTGTTALQRSMSSHREELRSKGILYPSGTLGVGDGSQDAHHFLAHAIKGRKTSYTPDVAFERLEEHCAAIRNLADAHAGPLVLSSEDFSLLSPPQVKTLAALLPSDTRVVVYLRRQDFWADSLYGQMLKFSKPGTIDEFLGRQNKRLDYSSFLHRWADAFGKQAIIIRTYEGPAQENLWLDFCDAIGQPAARGAISEVRKDNPSLSSAQTALLDTALGSEARQKLRKRFEQMNMDLPSTGNLKHITLEKASEIQRQYEQSNVRVAQDYLGRDTLFADTATAANSTRDQAEFNAVVEAVKAMSADFAEQLKSLRQEIERLKS